ncbi:transporter substrate-binding domain-containing protein [Agaribacterium haliotis]|uniref:transporter substrate-binding domain-containing protein n=1 Tax=Agaribacterium haliotis TaxID=2013869 RepID=UPI000BB531E2|nr:transporter substrate-binding domain-containing protein [Agaribacterium haliotis]
MPHIYNKFFKRPQRWLVFVFCLLAALCACEQQEGKQPGPNSGKQQQPSPSPSPPYLSTADFGPIQVHGRLRFIAPRGLAEEQAVSDRAPVLKEFYDLAEAFAKRLELEAEWIWVDDRNELIPALLEGRGDLIISNMSVTEKRQQLVSYSRSLAHVDEVVIKHKQASDQLRFFVGQGSAFVESLEQNGIADVELMPANKSAYDWLSWIEEDSSRATVLDSNIARDLIEYFPKLSIAETLKKHRRIAWAVRQDNPDLLTYLNHFLVEHHIAASVASNEKLGWADIKKRGELRMLTLNNPASYFLWKGEQMGFDYDLVKKFAEENKLRLSVIVKNNMPELIEALQSGEGDLIAASMTVSEKRAEQGLRFSRPYLYVDELIVTRADAEAIKDVSELAGLKVAVNPTTVFYQRLRKLQEQGIDLQIIERPDASSEMLLQELDLHKADFAVADSHLVALEKTYHEHIKEQLALSTDNKIAWGLRPEQDKLSEALGRFIKKHYKGLFYNVTYNKYFKNEKRILKYQKARVRPGEALSPYDELTKRLSYEYQMDWRLVTSQMYQESKFNPKARSYAGAQGLMQVLPRTGREFGFNKLTDPEIGIEAGLAYMEWLKERFPGDLAFEERLYFSLASYNAGASHVRDARRLASQLGYDEQRWFGNVEKAMLLLSKPEYYQKARFGYVRGREPVNYVRDIRDRYLAYLSAQ